MRRLLLVILLFGLTMSGFTYCGKTLITGLPDNMAEEELRDWYTATGIVKTIAETTNGLTDAVIAVNNSDPSLIPGEEYQNMLLVLGKTAQAGLHVDNILRQVPDHFGKGTKEKILSEIGPVVEELRKADLEGLFSKTQSPRLKSELTVLKSLTNAIQLLASLAK
jgi:hypothetical protein